MFGVNVVDYLSIINTESDRLVSDPQSSSPLNVFSIFNEKKQSYEMTNILRTKSFSGSSTASWLDNPRLGKPIFHFLSTI